MGKNILTKFVPSFSCPSMHSQDNKQPATSRRYWTRRRSQRGLQESVSEQGRGSQACRARISRAGLESIAYRDIALQRQRALAESRTWPQPLPVLSQPPTWAVVRLCDGVSFLILCHWRHESRRPAGNEPPNILAGGVEIDAFEGSDASRYKFKKSYEYCVMRFDIVLEADVT